MCGSTSWNTVLSFGHLQFCFLGKFLSEWYITLYYTKQQPAMCMVAGFDDNIRIIDFALDHLVLDLVAESGGKYNLPAVSLHCFTPVVVYRCNDEGSYPEEWVWEGPADGTASD